MKHSFLEITVKMSDGNAVYMLKILQKMFCMFTVLVGKCSNLLHHVLNHLINGYQETVLGTLKVLNIRGFIC